MADEQQPKFEIQRIYVKDLSYEAPNTPQIFSEEWKPEVSLDLQAKHSNVEGNIYEVVLGVTVSAKMEDKTTFLIEVQQAGVFELTGFDDEQMPHMLSSFCPNILFPYVREIVSDVVMRGGFPQLLLAPVNFDALYAQHVEEQKKKAASNGAGDIKAAE
jgi:preprotein translocase subunit SecB